MNQGTQKGRPCCARMHLCCPTNVPHWYDAIIMCMQSQSLYTHAACLNESLHVEHTPCHIVAHTVIACKTPASDFSNHASCNILNMEMPCSNQTPKHLSYCTALQHDTLQRSACRRAGEAGLDEGGLGLGWCSLGGGGSHISLHSLLSRQDHLPGPGCRGGGRR